MESRKVVGAVSAEILSAYRAVIGDFQEGAEDLTFTAVRAAAAQPARHRLPNIALRQRLRG